MSYRTVLVFAAALLFLGEAPAGAQVPSQQEIQRLLADPQAGDAIIRRLQDSGLTPAQVRARLQAAGYPSTLLDQYLGASPGRMIVPSDPAVRAMGALGLGTAGQLQAFADSIRRAALFAPAPRLADTAGLAVFGLSVFRRPTTQFLPALAGPVDESYRLGPGDVLVLILTGDVELAHTLEVTREGFVVIPQVGQVAVANLTMDQLRLQLRRRLARSYSGIATGTTRFDVTVSQVRMIQVFVIGEVAVPGSYQIPSVSTVMTALYQAGGPTERGSFRSIAIRRGQDTVATLDLYEYLLGGAATGDVRLETGDVVFVPPRGPQAAVTGAVLRQAVFEIGRGETLADVIAQAGGFRADAMLERIAVHRILPADERGPGPAARAVMDVPLTPAAPDTVDPGDPGRAPAAGVTVPRLAMEDGDSVVVDALPPLASSLFVRITGMVRKPGTYPWREGMTLRNLVLLARGPTIGADLREAELARLPADRSGGGLADRLRVPLDSSYLIERDSLGRYWGATGVDFPAAGSAPEFTLEPFDQVTVLKQPEFELQRTVVVTGEVQFPGYYALEHKDDRITGLIERAGGLLPSAYPAGGRFFRSLDNAGRVNVNLASALESPGGRYDVVLQPGDSLHVPEYVPTVSIIGAVNSPTSILFREGAGFGYYIENAGGFARNADKGRASVRYADGSARVRSKFLFFSSYPEPGPGSTIAVPAKPERPPADMTAVFTSVASILASILAIIVVATR